MSRVDERVPSLRGHFVPKLTPCYSRQVAIKYRAFRQAVDFQWFFAGPSLGKLRPSSTHQVRKGRSSGQLWHLPAPMERNLVAPSRKNVRRPPSQHPPPSSTGRVSSPISGAGGHQVPIKHHNKQDILSYAPQVLAAIKCPSGTWERVLSRLCDQVLAVIKCPSSTPAPSP